MAPKLYMIPVSPPVRSVLITAKSLNLELELISVNIFAGDNLKPEFLKINPEHTVPTLVDDDGFIIWDSHPIMTYLVSKYGKDNSLYPKDLKKRTLVDQRLYFDSGVIFPRLRAITKPLILGDKKTITEADKNSINEAYGFLEAFLEDKQYVTGDSITIADYALITTVTALNILVPIDGKIYPRIVAWVKRVQGLPAYEASKAGLVQLEALLKSKLEP